MPVFSPLQTFDGLAPTTTKGDTIARSSTTNDRLPVGSNGTVLTADSAQTLGVKWAAPTTNLTIQSKTADYTVLTTDDLLFGSTNSLTFNLFTAVGNSGKVLRFKKTDSNPAKTITIDANGSETIEGQLTFVMTSFNQTLEIVSDNANWRILNFDPAGEVLIAVSSVKTPVATDRYNAYSGNSLALTPGTWKLFGDVTATNDGTTPNYANINLLWCSANGADTNVAPADISLASNLTVLSVSGNFMGAKVDVSNNYMPAEIYIVRVTANVTVYLDTYSTQTTSSHARFTVFANAERLQ